MKNNLLISSLTLSFASVALAQVTPPPPPPSVDTCQWRTISTNYPLTNGDPDMDNVNQSYLKQRHMYAQFLVADPGCCVQTCEPNQTNNEVPYGGSTQTFTYTRTWTRSGKTSGNLVIQFLHLIGLPWEVSGSQSKTETNTTTLSVPAGAKATCGNKHYVWVNTTMTDTFEQRATTQSPTTIKETRRDMVESLGLWFKVVKTGEVHNPCTDTITVVTTCPPVEPCPAEDPGVGD